MLFRATIYAYLNSCPASTPTTRTITQTLEVFEPTTTYATTVTRTITTLQSRSCPSHEITITGPAPSSTCSFNASTCINLMCLGLTTVTATCPPATMDCCCGTSTSSVYSVSALINFCSLNLCCCRAPQLHSAIQVFI
ncbi:hypothetical protein EJ08DRAFT_124889 [Tothia fuscella]|uniref:Uncharacterized protein n=1 Tax=Tothia fuscella TaxID=1048955 RepID=A0A9P4NUQ6_9PEZI|nr:hypothetical protein EJ08DRAFT_124889 [Tothia fuscella]